jgi:hypothetical protein
MYLLQEYSKHTSYQELSAVQYSTAPLNLLLCRKVKSTQFCFRRDIASYAWLRPQKRHFLEDTARPWGTSHRGYGTTIF